MQNGDYSSDYVSEDDIESFGQFPLSLAIAEEILGDDPTQDDVVDFSFHGYSQGGTRAQLVSMYYAHVHELRFRTVTFGSTGSQCFTYEGKSMGNPADSWRSFVDPSDDHSDHIVGFYDGLDPYAVSLDVNVGMRCMFGVTDVQNRPAVDRCMKLVGKGLDILPAVGGGDVNRCTYYTHGTAWYPMVTENNASYGYFQDQSGVPDGGCFVVPVADEDGDTCQPSGTPGGFVVFIFFFIVVPCTTVFILMLCTIRAVCIGCGDCVGCVGYLCCCCCGGGGEGKKVQKCCYAVYEDASMFPALPCLCNAAPSHPVLDSEVDGCCSTPNTDAGFCNRACCCMGRPCTYCGIPCCPPGSTEPSRDAAGVQASGQATQL